MSRVGTTKPFDIPKREVWEAFKKVKANQGAAGVDGQSIAEFEADLTANLYKLWNRLSSGSYFPPPVRRVDIPKASGGTRPLGIPTVADRIAQEVVRRYLEPRLEPIFHADSYGYRPGRSALDAIRTARQRCWRNDWVLDIDIKAFFDSLDWELLLKALRRHTDCAWVLLYVERWLKAPMQREDGALEPRSAGTPQGGVISPILANLFLHYAFDKWVTREFPKVAFERYADDAVCHCRTRHEAEALLAALQVRFAACRLVLHPEKTKIVYCKDTNRRGTYPTIMFDFLGYTFRPRFAAWPSGKFGVSFLPAASKEALKAIRRDIRRWSLQTRTDKALEDLARMFAPYIRGWINYYGRFYRSELAQSLRRIDDHLVNWVRHKFKRFRQYKRRARSWLTQVIRRSPMLFAHWPLLYHNGRTLGAV
jgi:RNA-directed DNA polymerase